MFERLPEVDRAFIKAEVQDGYYGTEIEVVRDAVRRLREEKERRACFHAAVMKGVKEIEAGITTPLTPELMEQLMQEGTARAEADEPYYSNDAVAPSNE